MEHDNRYYPIFFRGAPKPSNSYFPPGAADVVEAGTVAGAGVA